MNLPWKRKRNMETRSGAGSGVYTDAVVQAIIARAGGTELSIPANTACAEMASGVVHRAFAAAEIMDAPDNVREALDPSCRGLIGRAMVRHGEALFYIMVSGGAIRLIPVQSSTVTGDPDPDSWVYELTCGGPSGTKSYKHVTADQVLHFRYAFDPAQPWQGVGPMQSASIAGRMSGNLSGTLADESGSPRGYLLPIPRTDGQDETVDDLRSDLGTAKGGLYTVEAQGSDWRDGKGGPTGWDPKRIGPMPPPALVQLQELASKELLSAFGLSPALFGASDGTSAREAWRQALHGLIMPLAEIVQAELRAKLDAPELKLTFDRLSASDISGRARAFQSLVGGGMDVSQAANLSGLLHTEE